MVCRAMQDCSVHSGKTSSDTKNVINVIVPFMSLHLCMYCWATLRARYVVVDDVCPL